MLLTNTRIGQILSRYKSGPLPKPFKILPTLPHWEDIIEVTEPQKWTPNAVYQATRIFSSSKPAVCQKFMEIVVLDKVREDIYENKKLNVHLFNSLKKSLYKPRAFFLGFLFPLLSSGCTVREAHIVSAVLARVSVPVLHSAAALKGITEMYVLSLPRFDRNMADEIVALPRRPLLALRVVELPTSSSRPCWRRSTLCLTRSLIRSSSTFSGSGVWTRRPSRRVSRSLEIWSGRCLLFSTRVCWLLHRDTRTT